MNNCIFKSKVNIFKFFIFLFLIIPFLIIIYYIMGFNDLNRDIWIICIINLLLNYIISLKFISVHYFYMDNLIIKYPTRITNRILSISYNDIAKTKYIRAPKGTMLFIIYYKYNNKSRTTSFNLIDREKMKLLFSFLNTHNIKIELNIWGQKSLYKEGVIPI